MPNRITAQRKRVVFLVLFFVAVLVLLLCRKWITWTPWRAYIQLQAPSAMTALEDGGTLIIDHKNLRVLWQGADGKLDFIMQAGQSDAFQYAMDAVQGPKGELYIRDLTWKENGMEMQRSVFCGMAQNMVNILGSRIKWIIQTGTRACINIGYMALTV